jgi:hypothetical protein
MTESNPQTVTFTNTGNGYLMISSITISGAGLEDFREWVGCGYNAALGPGVGCPVTVTFWPQAPGSRNATLSAVDNASGSPHTVSLTGTGVRPPTPAGTYYVYVLATTGNEGYGHTVDLPVNVQ